MIQDFKVNKVTVPMDAYDRALMFESNEQVQKAATLLISLKDEIIPFGILWRVDMDYPDILIHKKDLNFVTNQICNMMEDKARELGLNNKQTGYD